MTATTRTIALSTLPPDTRESLLFSLASEVDPNALHFSLLPDADNNPRRDPSLPVVAVTWRVPKSLPLLGKIGGTEFHHQQQQQQDENVIASMRRRGTPQKQQLRGATPPRKTSAQRRRNTSASASSPITTEEILTVSPVIRGSPTAFRRPSPFSRGRGPGSRSPGPRGSTPHHQPQERSAQWAQRHVEDFFHFAARSGVDTVQHTSVSFALQCYLQYQSALPSAIRHEYGDLVAALETYFHVCPASRLLHWLLKECDDFSGVAALSYLASVRFNDQMLSPRQIISLASRVETVAGHALLINRKYLRVNDTVAFLRHATKRWGMHAGAHAKKHVLHFLRSHRDRENAVAFDYVRHVDLYAFLLQLGKCYVATNAGRSGVAGGDETAQGGVVPAAAEHQQQQHQQQQQQHTSEIHHHPDNGVSPLSEQRAHGNGSGDDSSAMLAQQQLSYLHRQQEQQQHEQRHVDPRASPVNEQDAEAIAAHFQHGVVNDSAAAATAAAAAGSSPGRGGNKSISPSRIQEQYQTGVINVSRGPNSYAQRFEERKQLAGMQQHPHIEPNYPPRSASWAKRIDNAQATLEEVMRRFDGPLTRESPARKQQQQQAYRGAAAADRQHFVAAEEIGDSPSPAVAGSPAAAHHNAQRSQSPVATTVVRVPSSSRSGSQQQQPTAATATAPASASNPRARSLEPPVPLAPNNNNSTTNKRGGADDDDNLDSESAMLAEQVKLALAARAASTGRSPSMSSQQPRSGSQLEMLAAAVSPPQ